MVRSSCQVARQPARKQPFAGTGSRPVAGTGVRLVWSRSVDDPDVAGIYGVFGLDMEHCPNCGGVLKVIAAILEQPVIEKILQHLGLPARAPPRAPASRHAPQAACGLRLPSFYGSCDSVPWAVGFGCVRGFAGPMAAGLRPGIAQRLRPRETIFGGAVKAQKSCATFRDQHARVEGLVRGAMARERGRLKNLSSAADFRAASGRFRTMPALARQTGLA